MTLLTHGRTFPDFVHRKNPPASPCHQRYPAPLEVFHRPNQGRGTRHISQTSPCPIPASHDTVSTTDGTRKRSRPPMRPISRTPPKHTGPRPPRKAGAFPLPPQTNTSPPRKMTESPSGTLNRPVPWNQHRQLRGVSLDADHSTHPGRHLRQGSRRLP